jgi:hypothetical protein
VGGPCSGWSDPQAQPDAQGWGNFSDQTWGDSKIVGNASAVVRRTAQLAVETDWALTVTSRRSILTAFGIPILQCGIAARLGLR